MSLVQAPGSIADLWALLPGRGPGLLHGLETQIPAQIAVGRTWAWRVAGAEFAAPVALMGIVHAPRISECWLMTGAGAERHIALLCRSFRRQLFLEARLAGRAVVAHVASANPTGARLARASGLTLRHEAGSVQQWST